MKLNEQEVKAVLDALIFTFSGDACYNEVDKQTMKIVMEKIVKEYPDIQPQVYLHGSDINLFDDEENSKFVKYLIKNIN